MSFARGSFFSSSIFRKQVVALTGLVMVGFILGHMAGNLLIYLGPNVFNDYADKLASLGELLWIIRTGLVISILVHIYFTVKLTRENSKSRRTRYEVYTPNADNKFARTTMIYSGILLFCFLILHLTDFTLADKEGAASVLGAQKLRLFGLVWNSFLHPWRDLVYILAVCSVGLHLSHGIQSFIQTIGFNHPRYTPWILKASVILGIIVAVGFSSIPVYVMVRQHTIGY